MASHEKSQARTRDSADGAGCRSVFTMTEREMPFEGADAPRALAAPITELALWWCALTAPESRQTTFARWLSPAEQARMQRFGTDALRVRYLIGRGTLRWLLGKALGIAPADVARSSAACAGGRAWPHSRRSISTSRTPAIAR